MIEKEEAIARVERSADARWVAAAQAAFAFLAKTRKQFTTDDVWELLEERHPTLTPHEPRAMGPVCRRAVSDGTVKPTGEYRASRLTRGHARPVRVYAPAT